MPKLSTTPPIHSPQPSSSHGPYFNYQDDDTPTSELHTLRDDKQLYAKSPTNTRLVRVLYASTFLGCTLLLASVALVVHNIREYSRLENTLENFIEKTNLRYGYGAPLPEHGFSGKQYLSTHVPAPTATASAKELAVVFPQSIDLINMDHPMEVFGARGNVEITEKTSTILQFGIPEGLEDRTDCQLGGLFPSSDQLSKSGKSVTMEVSFFNIYRLSSTDMKNLPSDAPVLIPGGELIHPPKLNYTWSERPARTEMIGEIQPALGKTARSDVFACPKLGEVIGFEVACKLDGPACLLTLDEVLTLPALGFELIAL